MQIHNIFFIEMLASPVFTSLLLFFATLFPFPNDSRRVFALPSLGGGDGVISDDLSHELVLPHRNNEPHTSNLLLRSPLDPLIAAKRLLELIPIRPTYEKDGSTK